MSLWYNQITHVPNTTEGIFVTLQVFRGILIILYVLDIVVILEVLGIFWTNVVLLGILWLF